MQLENKLPSVEDRGQTLTYDLDLDTCKHTGQSSKAVL